MIELTPEYRKALIASDIIVRHVVRWLNSRGVDAWAMPIKQTEYVDCDDGDARYRTQDGYTRKLEIKGIGPKYAFTTVGTWPHNDYIVGQVEAIDRTMPHTIMHVNARMTHAGVVKLAERGTWTKRMVRQKTQHGQPLKLQYIAPLKSVRFIRLDDTQSLTFL